ncbi:GNAT family N-acetyltransferase [Lachnospiraceae bacterium OttesenSCG-928-D06]|nr:GNAT family N-acetyltransferase [Lachnospiraceae bacterium OttesenSCG-928-D06]
MLKNIYVILEEKQYESSFLLLEKRILAENIDFSCHIIEEKNLNKKNLNKKNLNKNTLNKSTLKEIDKKEESIKEGSRKEDGDVKHELWITDSSTYAAQLSEIGAGVLIFLHDKNKEQDFYKYPYAIEMPEDVSYEHLERAFRRLNRLPWDITTSRRCVIRETKEEDVEAFYKIYSNPKIVEYMENLYPEEETEKRYVREYIDLVYSYYGFGIWTIILKETGEVIGRAGFNYREGYADPEMGFVIGVPWQRKGIAFEVCEELLSYAKRELDFAQVQAFVEPGNVVSIHLCEKLGFVNIGEVFVDGKTHIHMEKVLRTV